MPAKEKPLQFREQKYIVLALQLLSGIIIHSLVRLVVMQRQIMFDEQL
jgi:hypothetical protein